MQCHHLKKYPKPNKKTLRIVLLDTLEKFAIAWPNFIDLCLKDVLCGVMPNEQHVLEISFQPKHKAVYFGNALLQRDYPT
jgi:hypothetical protein